MKPEEFSHARILVVDDEPAALDRMERTLAQVGYPNVTGTGDSARVRELADALHPDLVVLDLHMRDPDGFAVVLDLRASEFHASVPILMITGDVSATARQRALRLGASDFLTKPVDAVELYLRIRHLVENRFLHAWRQNQNRILEQRVQERTLELEHSRLELLDRLAAIAEYRDDNTFEHAQRVGRTSAGIARVLQWDPADIELIERAAPLHDIGKVAMPDGILLKPGPLTTSEFAIMSTHVSTGVRMLADSESPVLRLGSEIALSHHERWDGDGYREGLKGEQIPVAARIVAVADVFDALTHDRPYKKAMKVEEAQGVIRRGSGHHFDPLVVEAFLQLDPFALQAPIARAPLAGRKAASRAAAGIPTGSDPTHAA